jgi:hypothetical protein
VIVRPFVAYSTYDAGDYVEDPDTGIIFMVVVSPDEPDREGEVTVGAQAPAFDGEHFVIAKDLPDR